jgi:hypothetical protein
LNEREVRVHGTSVSLDGGTECPAGSSIPRRDFCCRIKKPSARQLQSRSDVRLANSVITIRRFRRTKARSESSSSLVGGWRTAVSESSKADIHPENVIYSRDVPLTSTRTNNARPAEMVQRALSRFRYCWNIQVEPSCGCRTWCLPRHCCNTTTPAPTSARRPVSWPDDDRTDARKTSRAPLSGMVEAYRQQTENPDVCSLSFEGRPGLLVDQHPSWLENKPTALLLKMSRLDSELRVDYLMRGNWMERCCAHR